MKKTKLKATNLRTVMMIIVVIIIATSGFGFYYAQSQLNAMAVSVGQKISESAVDGKNNQPTIKLKAQIAGAKTAIDKVSSLTVSSQDYQNQMIKDLNKYSSNTGVSITDYSFSAQAATGSSSSATTGSITITLGSPVSFTNLMKFLKSIESNAPKMQIKGIDLSRNQSSAGYVTVSPLTIEVYTK